MNERTIYLLAALAGGAVLPVQVALNTLLRRYVGEPMQVTFISYLAGALASLVICFVARYPLPAAAALTQTSWWMWIGGCLGTFYVWSTIFATPKIGAALALALTIAGQMIAALFLDHYGAIGLTRYAASPTRIAGVVLVVLGVSLVAYVRR
ncbi:DMT family transporter [Oculatella sp. FACHB-28]|uniref:DMT family transporter n=1 Tax=Cyanophyceae TaxID=3028117 RepID=UPI001689B85F|nr:MULTISPECIES: DMT family transporter [Cyanophyceae]MBD1871115.1 DMT family transporter [Cyanobacteria bacterium FACHB-471]MBD1995721.1 DMT family transporter [Leptolyngbya sp. FACHB-541]MBD2055939.1 DMT family transporter [Oculatella sp. FACHB-28]